MPKTVSMTWREYRRLLNATVKPDNYRDRLAGLKKDLLRQDSIIVELRQRLSDLQQLRDKANDGLMTAAPQIESLQTRVHSLHNQLVTERNGNAALRTVSDSYCRQLEDARRRLAVAGDLDRREIAVADAETRVKVALQLAQDMYRFASEMGRSVRPNRYVAPFPNFEQLVRDAKRADSDGEEID